MKKLVSVIIPTYNSEKFITDAIKSVLNQTYKTYEIIVVNDGSTDNTDNVLKPLKNKIIYIKQKNGGISAARNAGIKKAKGEFIAFLDADDVWLPTKLQKQIGYLDKHSEVGIVFSLAKNTSDPSLPSTSPVIAAHVPPNCLFRAEILSKVGLFDENIKLGEFVDWYSKVLAEGIKVGCVQSLLLLRRIHGNNIGIIKKADQVDYVRLLKKKIDREKLFS